MTGQRTVTLTTAGCLATGGHTLGCVTCGARADTRERDAAVARLRTWMPVDWSSEVITGQVRADLLLVLGLDPEPGGD